MKVKYRLLGEKPAMESDGWLPIEWLKSGSPVSARVGRMFNSQIPSAFCAYTARYFPSGESGLA